MTGWTSADHRRRPLGLTVHRLFLDSSLKYRAIGYIRVSTEEQADSGAGLAAQRAAIIAEADHCGWSHLDVIEDAGASGSDLKRPGITAALTALATGRADSVSQGQDAERVWGDGPAEARPAA